MASVGFHLQHLAGVLDRLFTYVRGETLSESQLQKFKAEGKVDRAIDQLKTTVGKLTESRGVGRISTAIGLYTHDLPNRPCATSGSCW